MWSESSHVSRIRQQLCASWNGKIWFQRQSLHESFILCNQMHSHQLVIAVNQRSRHPPGHMTDLTLLNFLPFLMKDSLCVCFRTADGSLRTVKSSMLQSVRPRVSFHSILLENGMKDVQRWECTLTHIIMRWNQLRSPRMVLLKENRKVTKEIKD